MTAQFNASDHCLLSILLERSNEEGEGDRAGITELLAAMEALTMGWIVPLGVSILFEQCDPSNYFEEHGKPVHPHTFVRVNSAPPDVRVDQAFGDPVIEVVPQIDAAVLGGAVTRGLDQPGPAGLVTSLSELWWTSVRVRSPIDDVVELCMPWPASTVSEVIDGARWCFGPAALAVAGPPARLRASNSHFATELLLEVYWDLWREYPAGRALVDAGVERVLARGGWESRQLYPVP
jgi:hypothetical protein